LVGEPVSREALQSSQVPEVELTVHLFRFRFVPQKPPRYQCHVPLLRQEYRSGSLDLVGPWIYFQLSDSSSDGDAVGSAVPAWGSWFLPEGRGSFVGCELSIDIPGRWFYYGHN